VTHDQEEAFALSDRIAVMNLGVLQQVGTPEELYRSPANPFVAAFVGQANFLPARILRVDGEYAECEVAGGGRWRARRGAGADPGPARVMVRPESLRMADPSHGEPGALRGTIV